MRDASPPPDQPQQPSRRCARKPQYRSRVRPGQPAGRGCRSGRPGCGSPQRCRTGCPRPGTAPRPLQPPSVPLPAADSWPRPMAWCRRWKRGLTSSRSPIRPKDRRRLACDRLSTRLAEGDDGDELRRRDPDQVADLHQQRVADQVVEQVVAVVAPHRHLALAVVQRMQRPPGVEAVLRAVHQIVDGSRAAADRPGRPPARCRSRPATGRDRLVQMPAGKAVHRQRAPAPATADRPGRTARRERAEPVRQRVGDVRADGGAVAHRLSRAQALQQPDQRQHHRRRRSRPQQPAGGVVGILSRAPCPSANSSGCTAASNSHCWAWPKSWTRASIMVVTERKSGPDGAPPRPVRDVRSAWRSSGRAPSARRSAAKHRRRPDLPARPDAQVRQQDVARADVAQGLLQQPVVRMAVAGQLVAEKACRAPADMSSRGARPPPAAPARSCRRARGTARHRRPAGDLGRSVRPFGPAWRSTGRRFIVERTPACGPALSATSKPPSARSPRQ